MASSNPSSNTGGKSGGSSNRGFASMDPQRQREIASQGGRAAHEKGTAHEFSSEEAREAGRKGGQARSQNNRASKAAGTRSSAVHDAGILRHAAGSALHHRAGWSAMTWRPGGCARARSCPQPPSTS